MCRHVMHQFAEYYPGDKALLKAYMPDAVLFNSYRDSHPRTDLRADVSMLALFGSMQAASGIWFSVAANKR